MASKSVAWTTGNGNIILTYNGRGDGTILVDSDDNSLFSQRSQTLNISGGGLTRQVTVNQKAAQYTLIEYVQNNATNVLNFAGLIPNDTEWEIYGKFQLVNAFTGSWQSIIRAYTGEAYNSYRIIRYNSEAGSVFVNAGTKAGGGGTRINNVISVGNPFEFHLRYGAITINGATTALGSTAGSTLTTALQIDQGRWYGLTLYHNGVMVHSFHPCIDANGKYGLVDVLTDIIYYPTKGTFDAGGTVITRNFKEADRKRILTKDGYFFNVNEE